MTNEKVYLVWLNDSLLGVYNNYSRAFLEVKNYKVENPQGDWYLVSNNRWAQRNGFIARLEITENIVEF